jgi:hypothetical protein
MKTKIIKMVQNELEQHPKSRLIDIYKLIMQSAFGAGHLIKDKYSAYNYLQNELNSGIKYISKINNEHIYPCLILKCDAFFDMARYSLDFISNKIIPIDDYFEAFFKSANDNDYLDLKDFISIWNDILPDLAVHNINGFNEDKDFIQNLLSQNKYLVSHSKEYSKEYSPSYRVIKNDYLKEFDVFLSTEKK